MEHGKPAGYKMIFREIKRIWAVVFMTVFILAIPVSTQAKTVLTKSETVAYLDSIARYELNTVSNPSYGSVGGEWAVMGLARYGTISDSYISIYKSNLKNKLKSVNGVLSEKKYTEYARVVIALTAIEEDPENFAGYNLLKPLAELDSLTSQGANAVIYALIALDCGNYSIPEPKGEYEGKVTTRERLVNVILKNQLDDGGWSIIGSNGDSDTTAMAVQALAPYRDSEKVEDALDRALDRLGELQQSDGGYQSAGFSTCESAAQVLTALSVMNISISDSRFVKNGNTVLDGLLQYYKDGGFSHFADGNVNQMATEQAMYGLVAYWRNISGMNGLFEMTDGITARTLSEEESATVGSSEETKKNGRNKNSKKNEEQDENSGENNQTGTESKDSEKSEGTSEGETTVNSESSVTGEEWETEEETGQEKLQGSVTRENSETVTGTVGEGNNKTGGKTEYEKIRVVAAAGIILLLMAGGVFAGYKRAKRK